MTYNIVIPARMKSTRLPGKPLMDIAGKPMIVRVAERAKLTGASRIVVATDHPQIVDACEREGVEAVLTQESHPTGTDRIAEVCQKLHFEEDEIVVNIQDDEPLIPPSVVDRVASLLAQKPGCAIATAAHPIATVEDFLNPNVVKVELNALGEAMTFTRAPTPWPRDAFRAGPPYELPERFRALHHIGLYAYRARFLRAFSELPPAPIEQTESLEQLRALWNGERIAVLVLEQELPAGVDTESDLERVREVYARGNLPL